MKILDQRPEFWQASGTKLFHCRMGCTNNSLSFGPTSYKMEIASVLFLYEVGPDVIDFQKIVTEADYRLMKILL